MKELFLIILIFISTVSFGQKNEIENLMDFAYKEIVPLNFNYFNLVDSSFIMVIDKYSLNKLDSDNNEFYNNNRDFKIEEFISKANQVSIINWRDYKIEKSKIYSIDSIPKFLGQYRLNKIVPYNTTQSELDSLVKNKKYNEMIIRPKKHWSRKRINKELEKSWKEFSNSIRVEDKQYFRFSTPVFSNDYKYAIIQLDTLGRGFCCVLKKVGEIWKSVYIFGRWIS